MELKVGHRVKGDFTALCKQRPESYTDQTGIYTGVVFFVSENSATIKRDDGKQGSGRHIDNYGYGWKIVKNTNGTWGACGDYGTLEIINETYSPLFYMDFKQQSESITTKTTTMANLMGKFTGMFTKEPWKTFKKLGITNGDDILTQDGKDLYIQWAFKRDADAFYKEVAAPILEEQEAEKKQA